MSDDPLAPIRRFTRQEGERFRESDPLLCRHLRTRTWIPQDALGKADATQSASSAQYWCLRTMRPQGPDGELALPGECDDERVCYEAMVTKGGNS